MERGQEVQTKLERRQIFTHTLMKFLEIKDKKYWNHPGIKSLLTKGKKYLRRLQTALQHLMAKVTGQSLGSFEERLSTRVSCSHQLIICQATRIFLVIEGLKLCLNSS